MINIKKLFKTKKNENKKWPPNHAKEEFNPDGKYDKGTGYEYRKPLNDNNKGNISS